MASTMQRMVELLETIRSNYDDRKVLLKQLKTVLSSLKPSELEGMCENLNISPLFDCLNSESDQIGMACSILSSLLLTLNATQVLRQYELELVRGLNHPDPRVKLLVMKQISRCTNEETVSLLAHNPDLIITLIQLIANDDAEANKHAQQILIHLSSFANEFRILFSSNILSQLREVMASSSVIRYRCYNVVVGICKHSKAALEKCVDASLLTQLFAELDGDDPLIQLNCLELLSELAMTPHCLDYLEESGTVKKLENMLFQKDNDMLSAFLKIGLFKFFGHVGHYYPKNVCSNNRLFINKLFEAVNSDSQGLQSVAIETVGIIAATLDGKLALNNLGEPMLACLRSIGTCMERAPSDVRIKALNAVASLLNIKDAEVSVEVTELLKTWFDSLSRQPLVLLKNIARQPFADLRCASMMVLRAVARRPWGQRYINDTAGFVEYLLDRSTEMDRDGKVMKYEIVKTLAESPTAPSELGDVLIQRIAGFVREGPFYVQAKVEIAFEGST